MEEDWSDIEIEVIMNDYFKMLKSEVAGIAYNKSEHRRKIAPLLNNRPNGAIEYKHQNISAVLSKYGIPWINGYKPRWNYQKLLEEKVMNHLKENPNLEQTFKAFAETFAVENKTALIDFQKILETPPEPIDRSIIHEDEISYKSPIKVNYLEVEQNNKILGNSGEEVVLNYEKWRLMQAGKESLSDKIEWVAQTQGDGIGYDILSKNTNGTDRYIEVKTTKLGKDAPIFFSKNEYVFSSQNSANYFLYRVFNFIKSPRVFIVKGKFDDFCLYHPVKYKGIF